MKDKFTYFLIAIVFLSLGLILGVLIQQMIIQSSIIKIVSSMERVEINIDELNETEIVDGISDFYKPYLEEMINNSELLEEVGI